MKQEIDRSARPVSAQEMNRMPTIDQSEQLLTKETASRTILHKGECCRIDGQRTGNHGHEKDTKRDIPGPFLNTRKNHPSTLGETTLLGTTLDGNILGGTTL